MVEKIIFFHNTSHNVLTT